MKGYRRTTTILTTGATAAPIRSAYLEHTACSPSPRTNFEISAPVAAINHGVPDGVVVESKTARRFRPRV